MKNLHLIPTDKPSRLYKIENKLGLLEEPNRNFLAKNQHIYITSDEQAKEGDWGYIPFEGGNVKLVGKYFADDWKKIILTTNQDLIADGVQSIDDTFLEWFVQNPSCESVDLDTFSMGDKVLYNVVFPKEEPKQETMEKYHGNTVEYWKQNAEENYLKTPISVLKYITVLEEQAEQLSKFKKKGGDK